MKEYNHKQYMRFNESHTLNNTDSSWPIVCENSSGILHKDERILSLYKNINDTEDGELREGFVFCYQSNAETEDDFNDECEGGTSQVASNNYSIFFEIKEDAYSIDLGEYGCIINVKDIEKVLKVIKNN
jgi:hypothetical protein